MKNLNLSYRLMLTTSDGVFFFNPDEIVRLEAKSNYTQIHFTNRRPMVLARILKELTSTLEPMGFIRTHRSHLVNPRFIMQIRSSDITMQDASTAGISRRKKRVVMNLLKTAI